VLALLVLALTPAAHSQTMTTAETLGRGKSAVFASANALVVKDYTVLTSDYVQWIHGLNNRVDFYGGLGVTTALGQAQANVSGGANINLVKSRIVSVSSYDLLTTAVHRRNDSSAALFFTSIVVSRNFTAGKTLITPYSGYSWLIPLGTGGVDRLFTPPTTFHNVPLGLAITAGKLTWFVEYNLGRRLRTGGVGIAWGY